MKKTNIYNAQHPSRQTAIHILESIDEKLGGKGIFDCKGGDSKWYDFEDMVTDLVDYHLGKCKDKITRRNKQIKALKEKLIQQFAINSQQQRTVCKKFDNCKDLKEKIKELELYQGEVDHFLIRSFGTSNLAEIIDKLI